MERNNNYKAGTKFIVETDSIGIMKNGIINKGRLINLKEIGKKLY